MLNLANNNFLGDLPNSFDSNKVEGLDLSQNQFSVTFKLVSKIYQSLFN